MKSSWKITLALCVILLAGAGMGYGLGKHNSREEVRRLDRQENWNVLMMRRLSQELDLSEEQRAEVRPLLRRTSDEIYQIQRQARIRNWQTIRGFYEDLELLLDEEQKVRLDESRQRVSERIRLQREQQGTNGGQGPGNFPLRPIGPPPKNQ